MRRHKILALVVVLAAGLAAQPALAQQKVHEEYTKKILEFTTDPCFLTKYVNYLPYAEGVPTPLEVLGHIAGRQGRPELLGRRLQVHAGPGRGHAAGQGLRHRQDRGRARLDRGRRRRRGDHQEPRQV